MEPTTLECPECKAQGKDWSTTQKELTIAKRTLSLHRYREHNIRSPKAIQEAERKMRLAAGITRPTGGRTAPQTMEELGPPPPLSDKLARSNWMKARWRIMHPDKVQAQRARWAQKKRDLYSGHKEHEERERLQTSSWWQVDQQEVPIKLDACPVCGARFVAQKPVNQRTTERIENVTES